MTKKRGNTVINMSPFDVEIKLREDHFELWFFDHIGEDYDRQKIVKVRFQYWWCRYLAKLLWKAVNHRKKEVDDMVDAMNGKE